MITVLTPTYNRAYILETAYRSLQRQTRKDFEWIVVDDGSTDNTEDLVASWQGENNSFPISYFRVENGGKHRAVNLGVTKAKGEWILLLDSDDFLVDDAIAFFHSHLAEVAGDAYAGIAGLRGWIQKEGSVGNQVEDDSYTDATNIERTRLGLQGDKAEVYKTALLRKYPFPTFEGEKYLGEAAVWDRIALDGYRIRWYNHVVYKCEYLEDGLTKANGFQRNIDNFQGFTYCTRLSLGYAVFPYNYIKIGNYMKVARQKGLTRPEACKKLGISKGKALVGRFLFFMRNGLKKMSRS